MGYTAPAVVRPLVYRATAMTSTAVSKQVTFAAVVAAHTTQEDRSEQEEKVEEAPFVSAVVVCKPIGPTSKQRGLAGKQAREAFGRDNLPSRVQLHLNKPFGKDNIAQSFLPEVCLAHVLIFVYKSGSLSGTDRNELAAASPDAHRLDRLIKDHQDVDFRPLQGFQTGWEEQTRTLGKACHNDDRLLPTL